MNFVLHVPRVLNDVQLLAVLDSLRRADAPWVDGRVTAGHQGTAVKRNQQLAESSPMARDLAALVVAELERNAMFVSAVLPNLVYPPMFNRYAAGMHFGDHVDGAIRSLQSPHKLRTDLSATLFLSPKEGYQGGELVIENDLGSQSVKFDAGDMVVYPAASRHRVNKITHGERIASVFWIQSLVRDESERLQLFELDRTIQRLTELGTEPSAVLRLTALYHSLLRKWSEP